MEDFVDEDTGKLGYTKKQEIFLNGYQSVILSPHYMRPNYRIVLALAIYFPMAAIISDVYTTTLVVPHMVGYGWVFMGNFTGAIALYCLWKAHITPAGYIDSEWPQKFASKIVTKTDKFCQTCNHSIPLRASHCRRANTCILRFDHWCIFTANAVGLHNHKFFILLLIWGSTAMVYLYYPLCVVVYEYLFLGLREEGLPFMCWFLFFITSPLITFTFGLLAFHSFLISRNITSKEFFNFKMANPFSMEFPKKFSLESTFENWCQVLGQDYLMWWNPFVSPGHNSDSTGHGYCFVNKDLVNSVV